MSTHISGQELISATADKAGKSYWDAVWNTAALPKAVNPRATNASNYVHKRFHEYFLRTLSPVDSTRKLLEVGCARSARLPYFGKEFGLKVCGLDYSEVGCCQASQILQNEGVQGEIVCADLFAPPDRMIEQFDFVVSFGVVEHFEETARALKALAVFLKPGGHILTSIPNMVGWVGKLQKRLNRPVFEKHVPLDRESLRDAHERAGFEVVQCEYFLSTEFGVCNLNGIAEGSLERRLKWWIIANLQRCSVVMWLVEQRLGELRPSRAMSPYIVCTARKPPVGATLKP